MKDIHDIEDKYTNGLAFYVDEMKDVIPLVF